MTLNFSFSSRDCNLNDDFTFYRKRKISTPHQSRNIFQDIIVPACGDAEVPELKLTPKLTQISPRSQTERSGYFPKKKREDEELTGKITDRGQNRYELLRPKIARVQAESSHREENPKSERVRFSEPHPTKQESNKPLTSRRWSLPPPPQQPKKDLPALLYASQYSRAFTDWHLVQPITDELMDSNRGLRRPKCDHCYDPRWQRPTNWQFASVPEYRRPACWMEALDDDQETEKEEEEDGEDSEEDAEEDGKNGAACDEVYPHDHRQKEPYSIEQRKSKVDAQSRELYHDLKPAAKATAAPRNRTSHLEHLLPSENFLTNFDSYRGSGSFSKETKRRTEERLKRNIAYGLSRGAEFPNEGQGDVPVKLIAPAKSKTEQRKRRDVSGEAAKRTSAFGLVPSSKPVRVSAPPSARTSVLETSNKMETRGTSPRADCRRAVWTGEHVRRPQQSIFMSYPLPECDPSSVPSAAGRVADTSAGQLPNCPRRGHDSTSTRGSVPSSVSSSSSSTGYPSCSSKCASAAGIERRPAAPPAGVSEPVDCTLLAHRLLQVKLDTLRSDNLALLRRAAAASHKLSPWA